MNRLDILSAALGEYSHTQKAEREQAAEEETANPQRGGSKLLVDAAADQRADKKCKPPSRAENALVETAQLNGREIRNDGWRTRSIGSSAGM